MLHSEADQICYDFLRRSFDGAAWCVACLSNGMASKDDDQCKVLSDRRMTVRQDSVFVGLVAPTDLLAGLAFPPDFAHHSTATLWSCRLLSRSSKFEFLISPSWRSRGKSKRQIGDDRFLSLRSIERESSTVVKNR